MRDGSTSLLSYALGVLGFTTAFLGFVVGVPALIGWINRKADQTVNLHVHRALHPNVTVLHDKRRDSA